MVGGFCLICILFVMYMTENSYGTDLKKCPEGCMCLGVSVDCSHKGFTTLPSDMPVWAAELNLNNNRIHSLDKGVLSNLPQLVDLKVNKNKITRLTKDIFKHQKQLRTLELNRNQLKEIEALSFQSLEKLTVLKLRRNHMRQLSDGLFWGLTNIDTLELDWNYISVVSKVWVYGLSHLRILSLSNNVITHIDVDVWDLCKDLIDLNLSTNHIGAIQKGTFKYLSQLEKLNLNNNNISHIEEGAFNYTPALKVLMLNNNKLSWTVEDSNRAFIGLNNLLKFHLASNHIKSISKNAFTELKSITSLDLSNNNITTVQNNSFSEIPYLKELYLNTSALLCDCNLQWFATWIRKNSFTKMVAVCDYPLWLRGKSVIEMPVSNFTCDDVPKPELIEEPKMKMALKGDNVSLYCKAVSSSAGPMKFVWKRDNIELHDVPVSQTATSPDGRHTEHTSELKLLNVAYSDQGKYQCVVSNSFGTTYSHKSRIAVLTFPKFSKIPSNMTVHAGETVRLECAAHGEPQPQIAWQKDGGNDFPAARERRMHVMPTDDVFFIVNVKIADMGVYSCTAQNLAGIIVANATLTVLEKPSFVKSMENKEVTAGEPIVLECMASGSPKPALTWFKDGGPLKATERHFFTAEDQLMIIVETMLSDAGKYECMMNNSLGLERGSSELIVNPVATVNEDDTMGIIIISVVCCAVGTSVVWVVIIYQTRKRINSATTANVAAAATALTDVVDARAFDNASDHSSCKDSGNGDSVKHSSMSDNFTLLSENGVPQVRIGVNSGAGTVSIHPYINNSHAPLLQAQHPSYTRSTNHDRGQQDSPEMFTKNIND